MTKWRKYTWRFECEKCHWKWKNPVPYYRWSGERMDMQCPHCGYKFFYFEFYPYPVKGDTMIMNTDDDEGA